MDNNQKNKNLTLQMGLNNKRISREGIIGLLEEMITTNSSRSDILKIDDLNKEYSKGFHLAKAEEFNKAKNVFSKADATLNGLFSENSFEFYCSQLIAIPTKSYLKFKMKKKDYAISLIKKSIDYAILLQNYHSSNNIGLYISQMLTNWAQIHMACNEIKEWRNITLENIHFLSNLTLPRNCQDFKISNLKKTPLRYFVLIDAISDALISIVKYKATNGYEFINSIVFKDKSEPVIVQMDSWKKLNVCLNQQNTETDLFQIGYNNFLESKDSKYDLRILKLSLKNRVKKERVQFYSSITV